MAGSILSKKLLLKAGSRVLLINNPANYISLTDPLAREIEFSNEANGSFNSIHLFVLDKSSLKSELKRLSPFFKPDTILWVMYPKKSSKITSDLSMNNIWSELAEFNLSPVASAAIDETWTAIRLKPKELVKRSSISKSAIRKNDLSEYINTDKRTITLPDYLLKVLSTKALDFFNTLSYTNKKEYAVWILTAKQEKTRNERILKMEEKLSTGRKNPTEK